MRGCQGRPRPRLPATAANLAAVQVMLYKIHIKTIMLLTNIVQASLCVDANQVLTADHLQVAADLVRENGLAPLPDAADPVRGFSLDPLPVRSDLQAGRTTHRRSIRHLRRRLVNLRPV